MLGNELRWAGELGEMSGSGKGGEVAILGDQIVRAGDDRAIGEVANIEVKRINECEEQRCIYRKA